jgi:hypothetical protein
MPSADCKAVAEAEGITNMPRGSNTSRSKTLCFTALRIFKVWQPGVLEKEIFPPALAFLTRQFPASFDDIPFSVANDANHFSPPGSPDFAGATGIQNLDLRLPLDCSKFCSRQSIKMDYYWKQAVGALLGGFHRSSFRA